MAKITILLDTDETDDRLMLQALVDVLAGRREVPTALGKLTVTGATPGSTVSLVGDQLREELPSETLIEAAAARGDITWASPPPAPPMPAHLAEVARATQADLAQSGKPPLTTLDKSGVPWDGRIHSSAQTINTSDGMWRSKRGIDEVEFGKIHAELQAQHAGQARGEPQTTGTAESGTVTPASPTVPAAPAASTAPEAPPVPDQTTGAPDVPLAPDVPSVPTADAPVAPTPAASVPAAGERWPTWAAFVAAVQTLGPEVTPYVNLNAKAQMMGLDRWAALNNHPDKWLEFWGMLGGV